MITRMTATHALALLMVVVAAAAELPPVGSEVEIHGLRSPSLKQFNGLKGTVIGHKQNRIGVQLPSPHGTKGFLPDNVRQVAKDTPAPKATPPPATPAPAITGPEPNSISRLDTYPLPEGALTQGLPVALESDDGPESSKALVTASAVEIYSGPKQSFQGMWWVMVTQDGKQKLRHPNDLRVRPGKGLPVDVKDSVNATGTGRAVAGVVMGTYGGDDAKLVGQWYVRIDGSGKEVLCNASQITPVYHTGKAPARAFRTGDKVEVRDKGGNWQLGTVTSSEPDLRVQVEGWRSAHHWEEVRWPQLQEKQKEKEVHGVGDRVEVRDADDSNWRPGTVTLVSGTTVKVKIDGWKSAHRWKQIRKIVEVGPNTPAPPPPPPNMTWPVNMTAIWEKTCWIATCKSAGKEDDKDCEDEYVCSNTTGCQYDPLEKPMCFMRRLRVCDTVTLAPGANDDQGSLRTGEVGYLVQDAGDDQPFGVRGPYGDTFIYGEMDLLPAWGKDVTWAPAEVRSTVLSGWKGAATFGIIAEKQKGAKQNKEMAKLNCHSGPVQDMSTPAPTPPPPTPRPPYYPPPSTPRPPYYPPRTPPPHTTHTTTHTTPHTPSPPQYIPSTPVPVVHLPPQTLRPTPRPPMITPPQQGVLTPGAVIVVVPEMTTVSGVYRVSGKHRGAILYKSNNCETKECVLFVSGGNHWMISPDKAGHQKNVGMVKTSAKVLGKPPHAFVDWEHLKERKWTKGPDTAVDTPEGMEKRGIDWRRLIAEHSGHEFAVGPPAAPPVDPNERRIDPADGKQYTMQEFISYYHGTAEWDRAIRFSR